MQASEYKYNKSLHAPEKKVRSFDERTSVVSKAKSNSDVITESSVSA
jgi:hypothetical protein